MSTIAETTIEADPNVPIIRITREFAGTPEQLLRAHTDPQLFAQWIGVRPEQLLGRARELAGHANDRHVRVGLDRGFGVGAHAALPFCSSLPVSVSFSCARTASKRR